jgi:DNA-directed RNA polymerase specialized sigma24 family protein
MELTYTQGPNTIDGDLGDAAGPDVTRLIRSVVQSELYRRRAVSPEDIEDVCSDAMVALLGSMERAGDDSVRVRDLDAYTVGIARRACSAWSRRRYPAFHRLRTRLRYLLKTDPRFALWQDATGHWVCGNSASTPAAPSRMVEFHLFAGIAPKTKPAQAVAEMFDIVAQPLFFNDLAKVCAQLWAVEDTPETMESAETDATETPLEYAPDLTARLGLLWTELQQLPQRQCAALLLNLRDPDGECATSLLVLTGTASLRSLAELLGIDPVTFAELWPRLPLNDLEIAERLSLTRQQVINLRKCARERLLRRMGPE